MLKLNSTCGRLAEKKRQRSCCRMLRVSPNLDATLSWQPLGWRDGQLYTRYGIDVDLKLLKFNKYNKKIHFVLGVIINDKIVLRL